MKSLLVISILVLAGCSSQPHSAPCAPGTISQAAPVAPVIVERRSGVSDIVTGMVVGSMLSGGGRTHTREVIRERTIVKHVKPRRKVRKVRSAPRIRTKSRSRRRR